MVTNFWLYDSIIYIYALSLLFTFSDAVSKNNGAKRMGEGLLVFVWVLQTVFLFARIYEYRFIPIFNKFETFVFFSWLLVTASIAAGRFFSMQLIVFFVNAFGFAVLVLNLLTRPGETPITEDVSGGLLWLHAALALVSYAAFAVSAALFCSYLFLQRRLKQKRWTNTLRRLPSLETLEGLGTKALLVGTPMLILSLSVGAAWLFVEHNMLRPLIDIKVFVTLFILVLYGWQIALKYRYRVPGRRLAVWNVLSFLVLFLNFAFANDFSRLHPWL